MPKTFTGRAAVFGLNGYLAYTGIPTYAYWLPQSAEFTKDAEVKQELIDPSNAARVGSCKGRIVKTLTIDIIPTCDEDGGPVGEQTLALARGGLKRTPIPAKVTLGGMDHSDFDGDYLYEGGERTSFTPDGWCVKTLTCKKYADGESTATILTTAVT